MSDFRDDDPGDCHDGVSQELSTEVVYAGIDATAAGDGSVVVPIRLSAEYLEALLSSGLHVEDKTFIRLEDVPNYGLTLIFDPSIPLLICKECGAVGDTSSSATFTDDGGTWHSAYAENLYLTRCTNPECAEHRKIKMVSRETVVRNARQGRRARAEF